MTHDGTTGFWNTGDPDTLIEPPARPTKYDSLGYLNPGRRMSILYSEIASKLDVITPSRPGGTAEVTLAGQPICTIRGTPDSDFLREQLKYLRNYADLRLDRLSEINQQIYDLLSFYGAMGRLDAGQKKYTLELMTIVQKLTFDIEMRVKHACWVPRPIDFSPYIMPMIQTPDHSAYPSGHSSESFALAAFLDGCIAPGSGVAKGLEDWRLPYRVAHRIAVNRTVAGVHFPVDSAAGAALGLAMGDGIRALAVRAVGGSRTKAKMHHFSFLPGPKKRQSGASAPTGQMNLKAEDDFQSSWLRAAGADMAGTKDVTAPVLPILGIYWEKVQEEWPGLAP